MEMPPVPEKPSIGTVTSNSISISWEVHGNVSQITHYTVFSKVVEEHTDTPIPWKTFDTEGTNTEFQFLDLKPDTPYEFQVAVNTSEGRGQRSVPSDVISTSRDPIKLTASSISKPVLDGTPTHDTVPLAWGLTGGEETSNITHYTIMYKAVADADAALNIGAATKWETIETADAQFHFVVPNLKPETAYRFCVSANTEKGRGPPSPVSDLIATPKNLRSTNDHQQLPNSDDLADSSTDSDVNTAPAEPLKKPEVAGPVGHDTATLISKPVLDGTPTHDTVPLAWGLTGGEEASNITHYTIMYKAVADDDAVLNSGAATKWETIETADPGFHCTVPNLKPDTAYRFCVSANTEKGRGPPSPVSDLITTPNTISSQDLRRTDDHQELPNSVRADSTTDSDVSTAPPQPLKPDVAGPVGHETVQLTWKVIGDIARVTHYTLSYKRVSKKGPLMTIETDDAATEYTVEDLDPETTYQFKVFANTDQGLSPASEMSEPIKTAEEPKRRPIADLSDIDMVGQIYREELLDQSKRIKSDKDIPIYQVPLRLTDKHVKERIQRFEFGTKPDIPMKEKIILVVGATGAGKSTLINGLLNYVIGVQWSEKVRFSLVEETGSFESQHKSQTKLITVYTLYRNTAFQIPYTLTIIDTPGFGDTEGIERDKLITQSISHLFKRAEYGIDHIDAIGFVAQSSLARLTPTQRYIFDSILSVFGADIEDNIFLLITFSDSQKPPLLASTREADIPYKSHFKFNNSALYASNSTEDNEFDQMFWKMGALSFKKFLGELATIEGKSLQLTKQVLDEREQLEVHVAGIQEDIHNGLTKLEQYRVEIAVVKQHEADIERNKDFTYTVDEHKMQHEDLEPGEHVTNCLTCNRTCHYLCAYANDEDKRKCCAMDQDGYCEICDGHCYWNLHRNVPYRIITVSSKVTKTSEDLQKRYEQAKGEKMNAEKLTEKILDDFFNLEIKVLYMTTEVKGGLARLSEIALRPNPLSTVQYLDILIRAEKVEARPGFEARTRQLENVKAQAKALSEMSADGYDPFGNYRETLKQAKRGQSRPSFQTVTAEFKKKHPSTFTQFVNKVTHFLKTGKI